MILVTHGIIGAAAAKVLVYDPVVAFVVGFVSHFLADMIPHWDYPIFSMSRDQNDYLKSEIFLNKWLFLDLLKSGVDALAGLFVPLWIFASGGDFWILVAGAIGGILPDFLQLVYYRTKIQPFTVLQRFHYWAHANGDFSDRPWIGIPFQITINLAVILLVLLT